jgi:hypothetical protein
MQLIIIIVFGSCAPLFGIFSIYALWVFWVLVLELWGLNLPRSFTYNDFFLFVLFIVGGRSFR